MAGGIDAFIKGIQAGQMVSSPVAEGFRRKQDRENELTDQETQLRNHLLIQAATNPALLQSIVNPQQGPTQDGSDLNAGLIKYGDRYVDPKRLETLSDQHDEKEINNKIRLQSALFGMKPHLKLTPDGYVFDNNSGSLQDVILPSQSQQAPTPAPAQSIPAPSQPVPTPPQSDMPDQSIGMGTIADAVPSQTGPNATADTAANVLSLADKRKLDKAIEDKAKADLSYQNKSLLQKDQQTFTGQQNKLKQEGRETLAEKRAAAMGIDPTKFQDRVARDAQDILEGRNTAFNIRQTMGKNDRTMAYMLGLRDEIHAADPTFDFIASDAGGKAVSTPFYQKSMTALNAIEPNLKTIKDLSAQVDRVGIKGVDGIIQSMGLQIGNKKISNFHEARGLLADELGVALGQGGVSDMKLQLGQDLLDPHVSDEVFASNIDTIEHFLDNRKKALLGLRYSSPTVSGGVNQTNSTPTAAPQKAAPIQIKSIRRIE
jgi:hypothetical protein